MNALFSSRTVAPPSVTTKPRVTNCIVSIRWVLNQVYAIWASVAGISTAVAKMMSPLNLYTAKNIMTGRKSNSSFIGPLTWLLIGSFQR